MIAALVVAWYFNIVSPLLADPFRQIGPWRTEDFCNGVRLQYLSMSINNHFNQQVNIEPCFSRMVDESVFDVDR